jgi:hypothetical protein
MLEFYAALHEYRDGDTIVPSVTQVLKRAGLVNYFGHNTEAMEMGRAVHKLCEMYARGYREDSAGRSLEDLAYLNGFARWMKDHRVYAIQTENMIDHTTDGYRYAGTFDLLADIGGKRILVDLKTGWPAPWHTVQLAAYCLAVNPAGAMVLYLTPCGEYVQRCITPRELLQGINDFKRALRAPTPVADAPGKKESWF